MDNENEKLNPPVEENLNLDEDTEFKKKPKDEEEDKPEDKGEDSSEDKKDEEKKPAPGEDKGEDDESEPEDEEDEDKKKKKTKHSLSDEEVAESELYKDLQSKFASLQEQVNSLTAELEPLRKFKADADRKAKQDMIDSFYMLTDADKADVVSKIDEYSLDDIEAKLCILCVRNKVSFDLDTDKKPEKDFTFNLDETGESDNAPAWIKAVRETAKNM